MDGSTFSRRHDDGCFELTRDVLVDFERRVVQILTGPAVPIDERDTELECWAEDDTLLE